MNVIVDLIKKTKSDRGLYLIAKLAIKRACRISKKNNELTDFIGIGANINPSRDGNGETFMLYDTYHGYIPLGTKIIYGAFFNFENHTYANHGYYYYLDDESYIVDFFKYLRTRKVENEYDILVAVKEFLAIYFEKNIDGISRDELHQLIYKSDGTFFHPVKEHSIKDFKGNGSALCSEYSAIAENILSVLGFDMMYLMDSEPGQIRGRLYMVSLFLIQ